MGFAFIPFIAIRAYPPFCLQTVSPAGCDKLSVTAIALQTDLSHGIYFPIVGIYFLQGFFGITQCGVGWCIRIMEDATHAAHHMVEDMTMEKPIAGLGSGKLQ